MDLSRRLKLENGVKPGDLILTGELDVATSGDLDERLSTSAPASTVRVDLSGISFIDSSGLRILLEQHQRFEAAGGSLRLVNVSTPAMRLLEMAGLQDHLDVN